MALILSLKGKEMSRDPLKYLTFHSKEAVKERPNIKNLVFMSEVV